MVLTVPGITTAKTDCLTQNKNKNKKEKKKLADTNWFFSVAQQQCCYNRL